MIAYQFCTQQRRQGDGLFYSRNFESLLVLDPFSGERWTLRSDLMPGWEEWLVVTESLPSPPASYGWYGVVYDCSGPIKLDTKVGSFRGS